MVYDISSEGVAISDAVHHALNDLAAKMTDGAVSGWQKHFRILLYSNGQVDAKPKDTNRPFHAGFQGGLTEALVLLPTPEWVRDSKQEIYICFYYELKDLMREWWEKYAKLLR